ncbi:polysaccharide pyruvyl transferase family protein [Puniceicoccus vermicola]|uniref:Polysaccharide pyruvyl transferase family protein n=1 Tax=Puniceicoccus vermicola TaxID=388746 RepID=A0A7X1E2R4_9BACT|nr:polysaccharide pyruvyl transferase family protein [Puniceicoccus vermicola]MBC2600199.1 polysaccharide pyruvyl transferase family protein [Puniceicoccus vermicola]
MNSVPTTQVEAISQSGSARPNVLIRSSWQTVNIGDIGHTPGLLKLLQHYFPEAQLILWAGDLSHGVGEMLAKEFPDVKIFCEPENGSGIPITAQGRELWEKSDYLIHGSGPYLVARPVVEEWVKSGRPFGVYGITLESFTPDLVELLSRADFLFCRDTISLRAARAAKIRPRILEFAPDAAFWADHQDHTQAKAFLREHELEDRQFLCVISRLRYTPYFKIRNRHPSEEESKRDKISEAYKKADHEPLRHAIISWVRSTGMKVLLCPEMTYEIELTKEQLLDPLPEDVRKNVVWRKTYWRPDEATSVYAHSFGILSMEMHSPILAFSVGAPGFYLRLPTDTCKGQMWRDIGLPEWIYEIEESDGTDLALGLAQLVENPERTRSKLQHAQSRVKHLQGESMAIVREAVLSHVHSL